MNDSRASMASSTVASPTVSSDPRPVGILLCAGYGTRLGERTRTRPKPLLELAGRPMLDYLLDRLAPLDLERLVVVSNHRFAGAFDRWATERSTRERPIEVLDDGSTSPADRLGAVGDLAFALEYLATSRGEPPRAGALVAAGDNVPLFSLEPWWRAFRRTGELTLLALHEPSLDALRRTGVLEREGDRVVRLWEKPEEPPSEWACPPLYALDRAALDAVAPYLSSGGPSDEIGRFAAHLVASRRVGAVEARGDRLHVGDERSLRDARRRLASHE